MSVTPTLPQCVLEEIALDGLDGITIEGLWKRLSVRLKLSLPLSQKCMTTVWDFIKTVKCLQYYLLPEEREPLKLYDRADLTDATTGLPSDPESCPYNDYKYNPISNHSVKGSCEHFDDRKELLCSTVYEMTLDMIEEKWGRRFVMVASQNLRTSMLIPNALPTNVQLSTTIYCILERLGRARYNGELVQGKFSLSTIVGDPIKFHSLKKKLMKYKLVERQLFNQNNSGQNINGQLLHLPRFFSVFKPRHMAMTEKVIEILKTKPNYIAEYQEVKSQFDKNLRDYMRRLMKNSFFLKFISSHSRVPYRSLYPNATEKEWKMKNNCERPLYALQLKNPNMDLDEFWKAPDDEDNVHADGFLGKSHEVIDVPILAQIYQFIKSREERGASEPEIGMHFGQNRLARRALIKQLKRNSNIEFYTSSCGRQKTRRYVLPEFLEKRKAKNLETSELLPIDLGADEITHLEQIITTEPKLDVENESLMEQIANIININNSETPLMSPTERKALNVDKNVETLITEIDRTEFCMRMRHKRLLDETNFTDKMRERYRFMERAINTYILLDDPTKLYTLMKRDEKNRGFDDSMCKKTFYRLLTCLCQNKRIRLWRIVLKSNSKYRSMMYITANHIDTNYSMMKSCVEQARSKFLLKIHSECTRRATIPKSGKKASVVELGPSLKGPTKRVLNYGSTPKFVRLRTLHEFLFYLVHEKSYEETTGLDPKVAIKHWNANETNSIDLTKLGEIPPIYSLDIQWTMFIPSLIKHNGFDKGWCLLSDCIFRMPLSIFVRLVNITNEIRGLDEILSHPIKKHFLLNNLPVDMQQSLFHERKYVFSIDDLIKRLCCLGLVQAGPHRFAKDQSFYYLNRKAKLFNTLSSEPGYCQISVQEYPENTYELNSVVDLQLYWDDMYKICMGTKLNRKSLDDGSIPPSGDALIEGLAPAIKAIQPRQAKERDIGYLPGDRKGAAGLDTSFYAHLERNWSFNLVNFKSKLSTKTTKSMGTPMRYNKLVRITRDSNVQKRERITPVPLHKLQTTAIRRRRAPVVRKKVTVARKRIQPYDEIDRMALKQMCKLRVDWNPKEDNFLLLCRVAQMYIVPKNRPPIPSTVIRDLVHWHCKSLNKTSKACARRVSYIMKKLTNSRQISNSVLACLGEIKENKLIQKRFGVDLAKKLRKLYPDDTELMNALKIHYVDLVHTLSCQYYNLTNSFESNSLILPNSLTEFYAKFEEKSEIYDMNSIRYDAPQNKDDIEIATIITLIHSTMCSSHDKTSFSIQLYDVYKDFPEIILSSAMQKVRSDHLISVNKASKSHLEKAQNRSLPLSASSYHLSMAYQYQMQTKISYDLFDEAFLKLRQIIDCVCVQREPFTLTAFNSTTCFLVAELLHKKLFEIQIEVPKRILILDPAKQLPNDTFQRIYARFHEIFNYIPKVDFNDLEEDTKKLSAVSMIGIPGPSTPAIDQSPELSDVNSDEHNILATKLEKLPDYNLHFFCIINCYGQTKVRDRLKINIDGKCTLNCQNNQLNPMEYVMKSIPLKREIWTQLNVTDQRVVTLPEHFEIDEHNVVAIYNYLLLKGIDPNEQQVAESLDKFKCLLDIVNDVLIENDKHGNDTSLLTNEFDFADDYDLKSDMKKKWYDGARINEKIHKFHDFLYVNTCKLILLPTYGENKDAIDIEAAMKKRDEILEKITENTDGSVRIATSTEFVDEMSANEFSTSEVHIGIDIYGFIESKREMGATTKMLTDKYEDKLFIQRVLNILLGLKLIMKTGVCQYTYVHGLFIKPWIINSYHLKRLDRESIQPTSLTAMEIFDSSKTPNELKRKAQIDEIKEMEPPAKQQILASDESVENLRRSKRKLSVNHEIIASATILTELTTPSCSVNQVEDDQNNEESLPNKRNSKRFSSFTIPRGGEMPAKIIPHNKKTFALKMAPWIRINGSINRRVLDKYMGTILLYCIENPGLTLLQLCTRFHYLLPVHTRDLVNYLEQFGCVTITAFSKRSPVTLFSTYKKVNIEPATDLDEFEDIFIEPTYDAVTKMAIFIGDKKYKEDFV